MGINLDKNKITAAEKKINRDIYLFPMIIGVIVIISFAMIIYSSIENYKTTQLGKISTELLNKAKENSKKQIQQVINRIEMMKNKTELQLKKRIKDRIYEADNIIKNIINEHPSASKEELKRLISIALAPIRFFDGRGYYLVYDKDTKKSVIHPVKRFIGKDMSNFRDKKGQHLVKLYDETIKDTGEGYANIYFVKPNSKDKKEHRKIVFVKSIPELNWVIGTGDYYDDVEKEIKAFVLNNIQSIRYGKNGYFWVHHIDHTLLMHPFRPNAIGSYEKDLRDAKGTLINELAINSALKNKKEGAFIEYYWQKPGENQQIYQKLSYVKYVPTWDWVIGTGVYIDDINHLIKTEIDLTQDLVSTLYEEILIFAALFLFFILFLSIRMSKNIKSEFSVYSHALTEANENLEKNVQEKTKELQDLNANLQLKVEEEVLKNRKQESQLFAQAKLAALGDMLANIAHQWRQPLSVISMSATGSIVQKNMGVLSDKQLEENLETINDNAQYLSDTINTFKEFIKTEKTFQTVILQERVKVALDIIDASFKNNDIKINHNLDSTEPINIKLVKGELTEVIINILNNAKDAIKERKIDTPIIELHVDTNGSHAIVSIEDNAGGIPEEIKDKIFNPYFTTKHESQGTGLGLHMSYRIIKESLKGNLYVENTNIGAKFYIELPLEKED